MAQNNLIHYTWGAIGSEGRVMQVTDTLTSMEHHGTQSTGRTNIEMEPSRSVPCLVFIPEDRRNQFYHTQSYAPGWHRTGCVNVVVCPAVHIRLPLLRARDSNSIRDQPVMTVKCQRCVIPHQSSALPASGTSTESAVASPEKKRLFKAMSAFSLPWVLLHYHLRRPSTVPVCCHADVYSATREFVTEFLSSCVNNDPNSHTENTLAHLDVSQAPPGCVTNAFFLLPRNILNPW